MTLLILSNCLLMLTGCSSLTFSGKDAFIECGNRCDELGYEDLAKCRDMTGERFYKCYSEQLRLELRCTQKCQDIIYKEG